MAILLAILLATEFTWLLYFYGSEERTERTMKLLDRNPALDAADTGILLGMSLTGAVFLVLLLT